MIIKLDRDYEVKCTLGTIKEIEDRFGKPFLTIVAGLDKLTTSEQIRLLYIGAHRADQGLEENTFISACDDNLGLGTLTDYMEEYVDADSEELDWIHINTLQYLGEETLLLSSREIGILDTIFCCGSLTSAPLATR